MKMERGIFYLCFVFSMFLFSFSFCVELRVYVSQNGKDVSNCSEFSSPCKTLSHAYNIAMKNETVTRIKLILVGFYQMNHSLFVNKTNEKSSILTISGYDEKAEVIGSLKNAAAILIGCSEISNCINYTVTIEDLKFSNFKEQTLIYVNRVTNVVIKSCYFEHTNSTILMGQDSSVTIQGCSFIGRQLNSDEYQQSYARITRGGALKFMFSDSHNQTVNIFNSTFLNNTANLGSSDHETHYLDPVNGSSHYGGALYFLVTNISSYNNVTINGCHFESNKALFGGALAISLLNKTTRNQFIISNTKFIKNYAAKSGGGFSAKTFDRASKFSIYFLNVTFTENAATWSGGGGKLTFQAVEDESISPVFERTTFLKNRASIHAALGLVKVNRASHLTRRTVIIFKDTSFVENSVLQDRSYMHTGTLTALYIDIEFTGENSFLNNTINSPVYACGSNLRVSGKLLFSGNRAYFAGGGISLVDGSKLMLNSGVNLLFHENYAVVQGGAVYYQTNMVDDDFTRFNPLCFVQYEYRDVPAKNWNVTVSFIANGAGYKGAAVYATTINQCVWVPEQPYKDKMKALRWSDRFVYENNYIGNEKSRSEVDNGYSNVDIETDTNRYVNKGKTEIESSPGEVNLLDWQAFDEYDHAVSTFATLSSSHVWLNGTKSIDSRIKIKDKIVYTENDTSKSTNFKFSLATENAYDLILRGSKVQNHTIDVIDYNSIYGARFSMTLTPTACPAGYKFDTTSLSCVCDYSIKGLTSCNWTTVRIHKGLWATVSRKSLNKLVVSDCPKTYCKCNSGGRYYTDCQFDPSHENKQCMENREGTLCGKCKAGSSIALPSYRCNECDSTAKSIGIFVVVILFAIAVCLGILYFNPKLSEYLKGIFFYTQILPYIFTDLDSTSAEIARMFCTVFNSVAVGSMPVEMCLFQGLDLIDAIGLSYIIPSICAVIVSIVYILGGYRLINLHRDSPFNAFWVLIIIVFKLLVDTSMHSLACTRVDGELVFFFDGNVKCFSSEHLTLFVFSAIILICLVIPLPILVVLISFGFVTVPPHVSDIVTRGYRKQFRWWCAFDLCRRLAYCAIYLFVFDWTVKKVLFIFLSGFICITHAIVGPYEKQRANYGETFLLGCLTLIAAFQAMPDTEETLRNTASIIAIIPTILYAIIIVVHLSLNRIRKSNRGFLQRRVDGTLRDSEGKPFPIPKRVLFERPGFRTNKRGTDSDEEDTTIEQSSASCTLPDGL